MAAKQSHDRNSSLVQSTACVPRVDQLLLCLLYAVLSPCLTIPTVVMYLLVISDRTFSLHALCRRQTNALCLSITTAWNLTRITDSRYDVPSSFPRYVPASSRLHLQGGPPEAECRRERRRLEESRRIQDGVRGMRNSQQMSVVGRWRPRCTVIPPLLVARDHSNR